MNNCVVCKTSDLKIVGVRHDDRYGYPGNYKLAKCKACGHVSLDATFTDAELKVLYSSYYPRSSFNIADFKPYSEIGGFWAWLDGAKSAAYFWVPKHVRVLDIGCGFGESLAYHQARGCDVYGVEADKNIRRVADKFGFKVHVGLFDPEVYPPATFDYVTMSQVIEHVIDPVLVLKGVERILKSGGIAILTTPNPQGWGARIFGKFWINWHAPYHLHFFSAKSMKMAADMSGLELVRVSTVTPSAWVLYQWIHLLTAPKEKTTSPFWKPGEKIKPTQQLLIRVFYVIHKLKINHLLARFFDVLGLGDNRIYILRKP